MERRLVKVMVSEIIPYDKNPRKNDKAVETVSESIRQTGYNNPIIVDENMVVLAGHTRLKSIKKLGEKEIEVLKVIGLSDEQKKKFRLLDNKASEYASWDYVALMEELSNINWGSMELDWGLDKFDKFDEEEQPDDVEEQEKEFEYVCPECGFKFNA